MNFTKEKIDENRRRWIEALRSGKYKQGKAYLHTTDDKYCCLGVACEILSADYDIQMYVYKESSCHDSVEAYEYDGEIGALPSDLVNALGMIDGEGNGCNEDIASLTILNDDSSYSFSQIADELESGKYWVENE